jgi:hypothetical protein
MWNRVTLVWTDFSEERIASVIKVQRISELRTTLEIVPSLLIFSPWWRMLYIPPKRRFLQGSQGITYKNTALFKFYDHMPLHPLTSTLPSQQAVCVSGINRVLNADSTHPREMSNVQYCVGQTGESRSSRQSHVASCADSGTGFATEQRAEVDFIPRRKFQRQIFTPENKPRAGLYSKDIWQRLIVLSRIDVSEEHVTSIFRVKNPQPHVTESPSPCLPVTVEIVGQMLFRRMWRLSSNSGHSTKQRLINCISTVKHRHETGDTVARGSLLRPSWGTSSLRTKLAQILSPWRWRRFVPPKRRFLKELPDVVMSPKTAHFMVTAVKTSNVILLYLLTRR